MPWKKNPSSTASVAQPCEICKCSRMIPSRSIETLSARGTRGRERNANSAGEAGGRLKEGETLSVGKVEAAEPRLDIADPWRFTIHEEVAEERRDRYLNERTAR